MRNYVAVAQWIKCSAGELKDPCLIPGQGEFLSFKEEMNQMVNKNNNSNKNNSSNSLVYGRRQKRPKRLK